MNFIEQSARPCITPLHSILNADDSTYFLANQEEFNTARGYDLDNIIELNDLSKYIKVDEVSGDAEWEVIEPSDFANMRYWFDINSLLYEDDIEIWQDQSGNSNNVNAYQAGNPSVVSKNGYKVAIGVGNDALIDYTTYPLTNVTLAFQMETLAAFADELSFSLSKLAGGGLIRLFCNPTDIFFTITTDNGTFTTDSITVPFGELFTVILSKNATTVNVYVNGVLEDTLAITGTIASMNVLNIFGEFLNATDDKGGSFARIVMFDNFTNNMSNITEIHDYLVNEPIINLTNFISNC